MRLLRREASLLMCARWARHYIDLRSEQVNVSSTISNGQITSIKRKRFCEADGWLKISSSRGTDNDWLNVSAELDDAITYNPENTLLSLRKIQLCVARHAMKDAHIEMQRIVKFNKDDPVTDLMSLMLFESLRSYLNARNSSRSMGSEDDRQSVGIKNVLLYLSKDQASIYGVERLIELAERDLCTLHDFVCGIVGHLSACESEMGWEALAKLCKFRCQEHIDTELSIHTQNPIQLVECPIRSTIENVIPDWWRKAFFSTSEKQLKFKISSLKPSCKEALVREIFNKACCAAYLFGFTCKYPATVKKVVQLEANSHVSEIDLNILDVIILQKCKNKSSPVMYKVSDMI